MRIEIDLPDWCRERHIYILAGIEMAAYKLANENKFHVKKSRCNNCGACCIGSEGRFPFPMKENGDCIYLERSTKGDYTRCTLGIFRPHRCGVGKQQKSNIPECSVEYEVIGG